MAKRRKRHYRRMGSLITMKRVSGLGAISKPGSILGAVLPPLVGAGVALSTLLGVRHFAKPSQSNTQAKLYKFAPLVGFAAGALASGALYMVSGTPAALSSGTAAALASGGVAAYDAMLKSQFINAAAGLGAIVMEPTASRGYGAGAVRGVGAVVPEYSMRGLGNGGRGLGSYGEVVNLGNVNTNAFGTPGFKVG